MDFEASISLLGKPTGLIQSMYGRFGTIDNAKM
jgi:hypothetical protein